MTPQLSTCWGVKNPGCRPDAVIFRRDRKCGELMAFLPDVPANPGHITCYARVGQHSEASASYYRGSTLPVQGGHPSVGSLTRELERIGYVLDVRTRMPAAVSGLSSSCKNQLCSRREQN